MKTTSIKLTLLLAVTACGLVSTQSVQAANNAWVGGAAGATNDWGTAANWSSASIPVTTDTVIINATVAGTYPVISTGSQVGTNLYLGTNSGNSRLDITAGGFTASATGNGDGFDVATNASSVAVLNLANTAAAGGALTGYGQGTGSIFTSGFRDFIVGKLAGSSGTVNMNTTGTNSSAGSIYVGQSGAGTYNQDSGLVESAFDLFVGQNAGSTGVYNLGGGTVAISRFFTVGGAGGTGTFNMSGGALTSLGNPNYVGFETGTGTMTVTNGTVSMAGELRVGGSDNNATQSSTGTVNILSNSTVSLSALTIGRNNGSAGTCKGTVNVNGGTLTSTNDLIVGYAGTGLGKLTINGGTVNVGTTAGKWLHISDWDSSGSEVDITNGNLNLNTSSAMPYNVQNSSGTHTVNQFGGNVTFYSDNGVTVGGTGNINLRTVASTGVNTYNLNGGTLTVPQIIASQANGTRVFNFNGGTLKAAINSTAFFASGVASAANVSTNGAIIDSNGKNITIGQVLVTGAAGSGGLTKNGLGTLTLSGANTYTNATTVNAGTLTITVAGTGLAAGSAVTVNGGGSLVVSNGSTVGGSVTVAPGGTLAGGGTISGAVVLNASSGGLNATNDLSGSTSTTLTMSGGLTLNSGNVLNFATTGASTSSKIAVTGAYASPGGPVTINLSNSGITGGTMTLITWTSGAPLTTDFTIGTAAPSGVSQALQVSGSSLQVVFAPTAPTAAFWKGAVDNSWGTADSGANFNWATTAAGTTTTGAKPGAVTAVTFSVTGVNNPATTLDTNYEVASLAFTSTGSAGIGGSHTLTVDAGGITVTNGAGSVTISNAVSLVLGLDQTWANSSASTLTISSPISGAHALTINNTNSGGTTLSGTNSYSGATTVSAGTLNVSGALGSTVVGVSGTLSLQNGGAVSTNTVTVNSGGSLNETAANALSGSAALTIASGSTATLSKSNNFTGATANSGTLQLSDAGALASSALTLNSGSTLQLRADASTTFANASIGSLPGGGTFNFDVNQVSSGSGQTLTLANALPEAGAATFNVTGGNGYTLGLGTIGGGSSVTTFTPASGANLSVAAFNGNVNDNITFSGAGNTTIGTITALGPNGNSGRYVTLTFNQSGTATLTGANNINNKANAGGTTVANMNNGTTVLDNSGALNSAQSVGVFFSVGSLTASANNVNLLLGDTNNLTGGMAITRSFTVEDVDTGTITIGGQNTSSVNTWSGSFTLGATANTGKSVKLVAATGGEVDFTGQLLKNGSDTTAGITVGDVTHTGTVKLTGANTFPGAVTVNGGILILTNANTYSGNTVINGGTLSLSGSGSISNTPSITVSNGATLDVSGLASTFTLGVTQVLYGSGTNNGSVNTISGTKIYAGGDATGVYATNTFNNNLTLASAVPVYLDLGDAYNGTNDLINVAGTLALNSTVFHLKAPSTFDNLDTHDYVLAQAGTVTGSASITFDTAPANAGHYTVQTTGTQVVLHYTAILLPTVMAAVNPTTAVRNQSVIVSATVTPGSGNITNVSVDLSSIGGSASQLMVSNSPTSYSYTNTVPAGTSPSIGAGDKMLTVTVLDDLGNSGTAIPTLTVNASTEVWNGLAGGNTWSSNTNWASDYAPGLAGDSLDFGGTTQTTPNMDTNYSVNGITFDATAASFTITNSANTLTLAGGGVTNNSANTQTLNVPIALSATEIFNAASNNITLNGVVSGGGSLTKAGTNTLTLVNANTYTGNTIISAGVLQLQNTSALAGSALTLNSGGTLSLQADADTTFANTSFNMNTGGINNLLVNALTTGSGHTLTVTNNAGLGGATTTINVTSTTGDTLKFGGNFGVSANNSTAWGGPETDFNLSNANVILNGMSGSDGGLAVSSTTGSSLTINGNVSTANARTIYAKANSGGTLILNDTYAGAFSGANWGFFANLNGGTLCLNAANAINGNSNGGHNTLLLNSGTLDNTSGADLTETTSPTIGLNGDFTFAGTYGLNLGTGNVFLNASHQISVTANTLTIGGIISDGGGAYGLTKAGNGTLMLTGVNTYTGGTTVSGGTLALSSAQTGTTATGALTNNDGGTLEVIESGTSQLTPSTLTLGSSLGGTNEFANVGSTTVAPLNPGTLTVVGTPVINIASMTIWATGTYPLITNWTSGSFALGALPRGVTAHLATNGAVIALVVDAIIPDVWANASGGYWDTVTPNNWATNGTFITYLDGDLVQFDDTPGGSAIAVTITNATVSPGAMTVTNSAVTYTIGGNPIAGSTALSKTGNGTLKLTGTNTYTGGTIISAGTLQLGDGSANNGVVAGNIIDNGSLVFANPAAQTYTGEVSGTGTLGKTAAGVLTLSTANTFTGGTVVSNGTLNLTLGSGTGTIRGSLAINSGGTVNLNAVDALGYNPGVCVTNINIVGGTLNNGVNGNNSYAANINLTGGTMTSSGGGSFIFNTNYGISSLASSTTSTNSAPVTINVNMPFTVAQGTTPSGIDFVDSGAILGGSSATLAKAGAGTLVLSGTNGSTLNIGVAVVQGGQLVISVDRVNQTANPQIYEVADGATLGVINHLGSGDYVTPVILSVGTTAGATLLFSNVDFNANGIIQTTRLTNNGTCTIAITDTNNLSVGTEYPLVEYGVYGSTGLGNFVLSAPPGLQGYLTNDTSSFVLSAIALVVTGLNSTPPDTNAYLTSLVFSPSAGFAPAFASNVLTGYNETNAYLSTPTVTVTNADPLATNTLIVNGVSLGILTNSVASAPLTLGVGSTNVVAVQVVSQDLSVTNTYVVNVTMQGPPLGTNAYLISLAISPAGTLSPAFTTNGFIYSATNTYVNNPVTVTAGSADTNATLRLNFNGGGYGSSVTNSLSISGNTLVLPTNTVAVQVVSQDLSQTNVYTVNVLLQPSQTVPKLTNSVSGSTLTLTWPADHLGYRLLTQTNNLNKGVSSNTNDWGTVSGSTSITTTNIAIIKATNNAYYRLVYP